MSQWRLIGIWGGCLSVGLLIGAASVRGGKPQPEQSDNVVAAEPTPCAPGTLNVPDNAVQSTVIPASYVAVAEQADVVALAPVDEVTRTLLEPQLRLPVRIELPAFPFVTEAQASRPTASDILTLLPLPTREAVTSNVPRELPNERRSAVRAYPVLSKSPLAAEVDPVLPARLMFAERPGAYVFAPTAEVVPLLTRLGLPRVEPLNVQEDPTVVAVYQSLLAPLSLAAPTAPAATDVAVPDPFVGRRAARLSNAPAEKDPAATPLLPVTAPVLSAPAK